MTDEPTNKIDTKGKEPDKPLAKDGEPTKEKKEDLTELEKLKASNDAFDKELIRGRELKKEAQKLEAEKMLGGDGGGHVEPKQGKSEAEIQADEIANAFK